MSARSQASSSKVVATAPRWALNALPPSTLAGACARVPGAVDAVVRACLDDLRPVLVRQFAAAGVPALVDDALGEVCVKILRGLPRFTADGPARLSTWAYTIAVRHSIDMLRKQRVREVSMAEVPTPATAPLGPILVGKREAQARVRAAVAQLPAHQRDVIVLAVLHETPLAEVAVMLDIEVGTVKSRLARGRARLRTLLKGGGTR